MKQIKLTVEFNTYTIGRAFDCLGVGGYCGAQKPQDDCHFTVTDTDCPALASVICELMMQAIPFTVEYLTEDPLEWSRKAGVDEF